MLAQPLSKPLLNLIKQEKEWDLNPQMCFIDCRWTIKMNCFINLIMILLDRRLEEFKFERELLKAEKTKEDDLIIALLSNVKWSNSSLKVSKSLCELSD